MCVQHLKIDHLCFFLQIEQALTSGSFKESSAKPKMSRKDGVIFLSMRRTLNSSPLENDRWTTTILSFWDDKV